MIKPFILWVLHARKYRKRQVIRFDGSHVFKRWEFLAWDEGVKRNGEHYNRPPWWRPFNAFLHLWNPSDDQQEGMHDHPRWSITLCLRGSIFEHTPWRSRLLTPGSVVIRSRKYIHAFSVPDGSRGKTWTLFIVGRRNHVQNTFVVTSQAGHAGQVGGSA